MTCNFPKNDTPPQVFIFAISDLWDGFYTAITLRLKSVNTKVLTLLILLNGNLGTMLHNSISHDTQATENKIFGHVVNQPCDIYEQIL